MILASLFGTALLIAVSTGPLDDPSGANLTPQQKSVATEPLVRSATDCIVHAVVSNPDYKATAPAELGAKLGDIIVASMPACVAPVRSMIAAYDRYYGEGSGEAFFMGPYLDVLPQMVLQAGKKVSQ
jgi:hypothetical protein